MKTSWKQKRETKDLQCKNVERKNTELYRQTFAYGQLQNVGLMSLMMKEEKLNKYNITNHREIINSYYLGQTDGHENVIMLDKLVYIPIGYLTQLFL